MDMERARGHHPWLVLAHQWPYDDGDPEEDFLNHVPEGVERPYPSVLGVFPLDENRTPIAKLDYPNDKQPRDTTKPFLKQFGPNHRIGLLQQGAEGRTNHSRWGPSLAHVMGWYWDEKNKEGICYSKDGKIYMWYDREAGEFRYRESEPSSSGVKQQWLYGKIQHGVFTPLASKLNSPRVVSQSSPIANISSDRFCVAVGTLIH